MPSRIATMKTAAEKWNSPHRRRSLAGHATASDSFGEMTMNYLAAEKVAAISGGDRDGLLAAPYDTSRARIDSAQPTGHRRQRLARRALPALAPPSYSARARGRYTPPPKKWEEIKRNPEKRAPQHAPQQAKTAPTSPPLLDRTGSYPSPRKVSTGLREHSLASRISRLEPSNTRRVREASQRRELCDHLKRCQILQTCRQPAGRVSRWRDAWLEAVRRRCPPSVKGATGMHRHARQHTASRSTDPGDFLAIPNGIGQSSCRVSSQRW